MSKLFCASGDYGIEFYDKDEIVVKKWIEDQIKESEKTDPGFSLDENYYSIVRYSQEELDAMPEQ